MSLLAASGGRDALRFAGRALGAAMVLLAFSEFVFVNEEPVGRVLDSEGTGALLVTAQFLAFYMLTGVLYAGFAPWLTSWPRVFLAGAFLGWSIEAAMVPVAYENIPFSYAWTAISWHAVVDVAFGLALYPLALRAGLAAAIGATLAFGLCWAAWSTWVLPWMDLPPAEFARLAAVVVALLVAGYALLFACGTARPSRRGRQALWAAGALNLALWAIWATGFPVAAAGLAVLAAFTAFAFRRAPEGRLDIWAGAPTGALRLALPALAGVTATIAYSAMHRRGLVPEAELLTGGAMILGLVIFALAVAAALRPGRGATEDREHP
jgi:hypothetical protein